MDIPDLWMYFALIAFVALSAFFSASESAFSSVNKIRIKNMAEEGDARAKCAVGVAEDFDRTISAVLIGNNIVNIAAASLSTVLFTMLSPQHGALISTVVMTAIILIFGEICPKSIAFRNSERVALAVAPILRVLTKLFSPIIWVVMKIRGAFGRIEASDDQAAPSVTEDELKYLIETIEDEGVLEEQESDLIQSAIDFSDTTVKEILVPRVDMAAADLDDGLDAAVELALAKGYSRIPVYEGSIDKIVGVLYTRDLLASYYHHEKTELRSLLRECMFVHRSKKIHELLNEFRRSKNHLAIVTDDYGGTMGLVTLEDILEELVGDIWDETDEVEHPIVKLSDSIYEVDGDYNIYDMLSFMDYDERKFEAIAEDEGDYTTVGGWALEQFEHIPQVGESFTAGDFTVTVTEVEDQRITKLKLAVAQPATDEQEK